MHVHTLRTVTGCVSSANRAQQTCYRLSQRKWQIVQIWPIAFGAGFASGVNWQTQLVGMGRFDCLAARFVDNGRRGGGSAASDMTGADNIIGPGSLGRQLF